MADSGGERHSNRKKDRIRSEVVRPSREPPRAGDDAGEQGHVRRRLSRRSKEAPAEQDHGPGPTRRPHPSPRVSPYGVQVGVRNRLEMTQSRDSGTRLYISNLGYGVSDDDIRILFSDVGELHHASIHYDRRGRSRGTGEALFVHHSDAMAAMRRYQNVALDGRPMRVNEIGTPVSAIMPTHFLEYPTPMAPIDFAPPSIPPNLNSYQGYEEGESSRGVRRDGGQYNRYQRHYGNEGRRGRSHNRQVTAAELDADLDAYRMNAGKRHVD